ncbi:hypothetical protein PanWU01x14_353430, partial [Parasponia andersonii]
MPNYFTTQYMMSTVIPAAAEIESFDKDGNPCYAFSSKAGHCYWDVCNCQMCASGDWPEAKPQTKKTGRILKEQLEAKSEKVGLLGQPSGKFDYIVKYSCPQNIQQEPPLPPSGWNDHNQEDESPQHILPCYKKMAKWIKKEQKDEQPDTPTQSILMMSSYNKDFPPVGSFHDQTGTTTHLPKVLNPTTRDPDGTTKKISPAEVVLNWQTENMIAQNSVLQKIDQKVAQ